MPRRQRPSGCRGRVPTHQLPLGRQGVLPMVTKAQVRKRQGLALCCACGRMATYQELEPFDPSGKGRKLICAECADDPKVRRPK